MHFWPMSGRPDGRPQISNCHPKSDGNPARHSRPALGEAAVDAQPLQRLPEIGNARCATSPGPRARGRHHSTVALAALRAAVARCTGRGVLRSAAPSQGFATRFDTVVVTYRVGAILNALITSTAYLGDAPSRSREHWKAGCPLRRYQGAPLCLETCTEVPIDRMFGTDRLDKALMNLVEPLRISA